MKKVIPATSVLIPDEAQAIFHGQIFDAYQWSQALFDGSNHTFEMLKRPDTVVAICIVDDEKILVVDDEQPHFGSRKSFPGGRVDESDQSVEAAVRREVAEETGYTFKQWRLIQVHQPHNKIEWFVYLFIAWDVASQDKPHLDPGEKITTERYNFDELKTLTLNKTGYLSDVKDLFRDLSNVEQLLALPAFDGQTVDR
jgi:ADP-ribose pyrophosphatase